MRLVWNVGRLRHPGYLNGSTQQPVLMNLSDFAYPDLFFVWLSADLG